ncbi:hypothetical protein TNCT_618911 [Trichonephila clavata]|uniref:Uncharacterized protein n=1 Tax=Trichonephila clavata TaxID=2740835 RepID=A0A8X6HPH4_TRICU|nr:hypothetical protein TNCT_618911 [Trichonephila clavata]
MIQSYLVDADDFRLKFDEESRLPYGHHVRPNLFILKHYIEQYRNDRKKEQLPWNLGMLHSSVKDGMLSSQEYSSLINA